MPSSLETAMNSVLQQGPLVVVLAIIVYFGGKYLKSVLDRAAAREDAREARYQELQDKMVDLQGSQIKSVTEALVGNTAILERVERKLNG